MNHPQKNRQLFNRSGAPILIAGPCVLESPESAVELAQSISELPAAKNFRFVFKASYLKDNRSSGESFRGPGIEKGLDILQRIRRSVGCPVLSDVHCRQEVQPAAEVLDALQIPAFLCRQTRLLEAAAGCGKPVNVKKGQFLAPEDMQLVINKLKRASCSDVAITERGSVFGYHDLVVDYRSLAKMMEFGCPVIFDVTHSLQKPASLGGRSGGDPGLARVMARAAAAVPCGGLFIETHFNPEKALSDGASMLPFSELNGLLMEVYEIITLVKKM